MIRNYVLPLLALLGLGFASYTVAQGAKTLPVAKPIADPARAPFENVISGAGIIEARSQNLAIAAPLPGLVVEVGVKVGDHVKRGDVLFRLDDRDRKGLRSVRQAELDAARAELARELSLPRPEDLVPARARVTAAESTVADTKNQLAIAESLEDKRAIALQEWDRRRFAVRTAEAHLDESKAELARLEAGAWKPDVEIARARVATAESQLSAVEIELDRLIVRAPIEGDVLQVNVRLGEFAIAGVSATPLLVLGDVSVLHVRVDIDENDVWRLTPGTKGVAFVRGNRELETPLEFVRIDPYVVPKRSLTGESTERVDTRVLQVLYSFPAKALPVFVGQQMDVFLEARGSAGAGR